MCLSSTVKVSGWAIQEEIGAPWERTCKPPKRAAEGSAQAADPVARDAVNLLFRLAQKV